ncbi:hypothetical protein ASF24_15565 [Methylobacterium sp. Leaf86]|uniref:TIGR04282 family arsenosugar biosynthesis glycosyltransferase n=1 Tax=Methylobacterium sp. Leaf86 TaxID=1736242 RepID=UPI0006FF77A3|nr:TIGR04282 family arsenosugar biosynthesis glycosyltransferase [Methylobacterium sp. Leaf86]KQO58058.1 hypothetical protein ASF24_15565 [Methylobacterium sp. Leaf86]
MTSPRLVLFTRYPEPGKAKTRLIPALGPDGAAALHRRLTERTLASMRATGLPIEIRSTGAAEGAFLEWLGQDLDVVDQGEGDLGARLARAASRTPAILLGADTPALTANHLVALAHALASNPAAIGPAEDGGYWALGIARPMPFLFEDMPWSTDQVCAITLERLAERGFEAAILDTLSDLDRPEDLARFPDVLA